MLQKKAPKIDTSSIVIDCSSEMCKVVKSNRPNSNSVSSTSFLLQNRLSRKAKAILTQGVLIAISVGIVTVDVFNWCTDAFNTTPYRAMPRTYSVYNETTKKLDYYAIAQYDDDFVFRPDRVTYPGSYNPDDIEFDDDQFLSYRNKLANTPNRWDGTWWLKTDWWSESDDAWWWTVVPFDELTVGEELRMCLWPYLYAPFISVCGFLIIAPILAGLFHYIHSLYLGKRSNFEPHPEVEKLYARTNALPFVDTVLEVGITWKYGSRLFLVLGTLMFLLAASASLYVAYSSGRSMTVSLGIQLAVASVLFNCYQQFGDINEYWVHYYTARQPMESNEGINYLGSKLWNQYKSVKKLGFDKDYEEAFETFENSDSDEVKKLLKALCENRDQITFIQQRMLKNLPQEFLAHRDRDGQVSGEADEEIIPETLALGMSFLLPFLPEEVQQNLEPFTA